ncbi:Methyltransferase-like protein 7A [Zalerion maritima]|uniref:Methyltransferase-like protein 7A n=1 Tax=Zalerion maritima TaxID=339359 RepID=A0AAD5WUS3_9PEZI|nr:Methyltransferase-like protein 7A [Zalerion maritima]
MCGADDSKTAPPASSRGIKDLLLVLADPWIFMSASLSYLPGTVLELVKTRDFGTLFSRDRLQTKWFGRFWSWAGPMVRATGEARVVPLLEGRVAGGRITDVPVKEGVRGTVVEVGAGSGMWANLFRDGYAGEHGMEAGKATGVGAAGGGGDDDDGAVTKRAGATGGEEGEVLLGRGAVTKVYGVEPNPQSHEALTKRVKDVGLEDIYEVVPVGIEHLGGGHWKWEKPIEKESVDCIVSILCLCSIPDPEDNIRDMYQYLKPGGHWYVYEHVQCSHEVGRGMRWYQWVLNIFWPHIMGGCYLNRDTETTLRNCGSWSAIDLARPVGEPWYVAVPHLYGVLRK